MKFTSLALLLSSAAAEGHVLRASAISASYDDDETLAMVQVGDGEKCSGWLSCKEATAAIGDHSCLGYKSCKGASGSSIGSNSCTGSQACKDSSGAIGSQSCTIKEACEDTKGSIGDDSCNDKKACPDAEAKIGKGSCNGQGACDFAKGTIGDNSCSWLSACKNTKVTSFIGSNSCLSAYACSRNSGLIGNNSCNGYEACLGNTETIPDNCPSLSEFNLGRCTGSVGSGMTLAEEQTAGNARWLLRAMPWGGFTNSAGDPTVNKHDFKMSVVSMSDAPTLFANAIPFASDHDSGRIFFYLNGYHDLPGATLTVSQGGVNPALFAVSGCGTSPDSIVDIQEPQCTKLSVSGDAYHCGHKGDKEECMSTGKAALFAVHPEMEEWDVDKYMVHELYPRDDGFWMINFYGGNAGAQMGGLEGFTKVPEEYIKPHEIQGGYTYEVPPFAEEALPEDAATRARWIAHNALWSTVSTLDDEGGGYTFGNPRSITDGQSLALSTGFPVFVCPDEDATAVDLEASGMQLALSFSEGQVFGRVSADGDTCGGMCAEVVVYGTAEVLEVNSTEYDQVLADFKVTHPLADWIWQGGSHMSSKYYTLKPARVLLRDSPEQAAQSIDVDEYLGVAFSGDDAEDIKLHKLVRNQGYVALGE